MNMHHRKQGQNGKYATKNKRSRTRSEPPWWHTTQRKRARTTQRKKGTQNRLSQVPIQRAHKQHTDLLRRARHDGHKLHRVLLQARVHWNTERDRGEEQRDNGYKGSAPLCLHQAGRERNSSRQKSFCCKSACPEREQIERENNSSRTGESEAIREFVARQVSGRAAG